MSMPSYCANARFIHRFAATQLSLQRLGYTAREASRILGPERLQWVRDNVPPGYDEQLLAIRCDNSLCEQCQSAYVARRAWTFRQSVDAFIRLATLSARLLHFQTITVPDYAPFPEHVYDFLAGTEWFDSLDEEERELHSAARSYYQEWFELYLWDCEDKFMRSLQKCLEHWQERGVLSEDGDVVPVVFSASVLSAIPEVLLSKEDKGKVYAIATNRIKKRLRGDIRSELAARRGYADFAEAYAAIPVDLRPRFNAIVSELVLERFRENRHWLHHDVADWFNKARATFRHHVYAEIGFTDDTPKFQEAVRNAWLLHCWESGWLGAVVRSPVGEVRSAADKLFRKYLPVAAKRHTTVKGRPVVRIEYGHSTSLHSLYCAVFHFVSSVADGSAALLSLLGCRSLLWLHGSELLDIEPDCAGQVDVPADAPILRLPGNVLTELLKLYRKRTRRAGLRFVYCGIEEVGSPVPDKRRAVRGLFHHFHSAMCFPGIAADGSADGGAFNEYSALCRMQQDWHKVSGNRIWKRGRWSERVRKPERAGVYLSKYMGKHFSHSDGSSRRLVRISGRLGLRHNIKEERLMRLGLLPHVDAEFVLDVKSFCFKQRWTPEELDACGEDIWVGVTYVERDSGARVVLPSHYRVDAVARCSGSPSSVGSAASFLCWHRVHGRVTSLRETLTWLPYGEFLCLVAKPASLVRSDAISAAGQMLWRLRGMMWPSESLRPVYLEDDAVRAQRELGRAAEVGAFHRAFQSLRADAERFLSYIPPPSSVR